MLMEASRHIESKSWEKWKSSFTLQEYLWNKCEYSLEVEMIGCFLSALWWPRQGDSIFSEFFATFYMSQMFPPNLVKNTSIQSQTFFRMQYLEFYCRRDSIPLWIWFCVLPDTYRCPLTHQLEHKLQNQTLISKLKIHNFQNSKFWCLLLYSRKIFLNSWRVVVEMVEVSWNKLPSFPCYSVAFFFFFSYYFPLFFIYVFQSIVFIILNSCENSDDKENCFWRTSENPEVWYLVLGQKVGTLCWDKSLCKFWSSFSLPVF